MSSLIQAAFVLPRRNWVQRNESSREVFVAVFGDGAPKPDVARCLPGLVCSIQSKESRPRLTNCHQENSPGSFNGALAVFLQQRLAHRTQHVVWGTGFCFLALMWHGPWQSPATDGATWHAYVLILWCLHGNWICLSRKLIKWMWHWFFSVITSRENFCLTFLGTLTGLTSKAKDVPSSSTNPIAKFLFRKSLWERLDPALV